jgi:phage terminase large subunit-like protein
MIERIKGRYERLCDERHARDLELSLRPGGHPAGLRFDAELGNRVVKFIEGYCKHHKGEWAGQPLLLADFQRDILRQIFGWVRADGTRRFRTAYIELARKNGKSTVAGGIGLYLTLADGEQGAEIYSSATKKDQAAILWKDAAAMVKSSADLKRYIKVLKSNMMCEAMNSKFEPLGADSNTLDGLNPHGNIVDELHAHKDRGVWDVLDSAMGARRQPLTIAITTAGVYDPESIGWEMHEYAQKILDQIIEDDSFFAFIASADEGEETERLLKTNPGYYFTEEALKKANPNYGTSAKADYLQRQAKKARQLPGFLTEYLTKHVNVWARAAKRWLSMEKWSQCEDAPGLNARALALEREQTLLGKDCYGGLDLSSKLDLTAFVLVFPGTAEVLDVICRFWLPEETVKLYAEKGQRHYEKWVEQGWLTTTPGNTIDYDFIRAEVNALAKKHKLIQLAYDPWGAQRISTQLLADALPAVECGQGYKSLSEPSKDLEARVVDGKVRHANNPILRFCASNAIITTDAAGNVKPDKSRSRDRIDGIMAMVMALSRFIVAKPPENEAPYIVRRGLVVLG